ncbi:vinexin [Rhinophrynus dorsalis]
MQSRMDLRDAGSEVPLTLDDFIPPHLQRKQRSGCPQSPVENTQWPGQQPPSVESDVNCRTIVTSEEMIGSPGQRRERHWIRYDGIGPTDKDGMPFASRSSVDKPRDWYRNMFRVLHQLSDSEDSDQESNGLPHPAHHTLPMPSKSGYSDNLQQNHYNLADPKVTTSHSLRESQRTQSPTPAEPQRIMSFTLRDPQKTISSIPRQQQRTLSPIHSEGQRTFSSIHREPLSPTLRESARTLSTTPTEGRMLNSSLEEPHRTLSTTSREPQRSLGATPREPQRILSTTSAEPNLITSSSSTSPHPYLGLYSEPPKHSFSNSMDAQISYRTPTKELHSTLGAYNSDPQPSQTSPPRKPLTALNSIPMETQKKAGYTTGLVQTSLHITLGSVDKSCHPDSESIRYASNMTTKGPQSSNNLCPTHQFPSLECTQEDICSPLSSPSKESLRSRDSTSKVLEQLETELRQFTEELDRDLDCRRQIPLYTLTPERTEIRSFSTPEFSPGGSSKTNVIRTPIPTNNTEEKQMTTAVVKFDFLSQSPKELSLQRGSTVRILKKVDKNWLLGEQEGRTGLFPESYVRVLFPGQSVQSDTPQLSAVALYDFPADSDAELSFCKGQRLSITRRVGGSWFEGRVEGSERLGLFPVSYVKVTGASLQEREQSSKNRGDSERTSTEKLSFGNKHTENTSSLNALAPSGNREQHGTLYRALYDFVPNNPDELHLITGDVVTVTQQCEDGWYVGVCQRTNNFGTFPGNFVAPYVISEGPTSHRPITEANVYRSSQ